MGFLDRIISGLTGRPAQQPGPYGQQYGAQQSGYRPGAQQYGRAGYEQGQARYDADASGVAGVPGMQRVQDAVPGGGRLSDEEAIRRYRYLLDTAPPEQIEEAHAEAFAQLTPDQRRQVLEQLKAAGAEPVQGQDPRAMARSATRLEMRRPGSLFGAFGGSGFGRGGMGVGGMGMGGVLLTSVAGAFIGSAIAGEMFDHDGFMDWNTGGAEQFADGGGFDGGGFDGGGDAGGGGGLFDTDFGGGDFGGFDGGDFF